MQHPGTPGVNQLGGLFVNGCPLPILTRKKIVELASCGLRASDISRHLKVSNGCVSKILTRYHQSGVIQPKAVGGSRPRVSAPQVVARIAQLKQEQPSLFAWEIRRKLRAEGLSATHRTPSVSSINRILRSLPRGVALPDPPAIPGKPLLSEVALTPQQSWGKNGSPPFLPSEGFSSGTPEPPPALPEGARGQRSRPRRAFSKPQWGALEEEFQRRQYPGTATQEKLSAVTQLPSATIRVWFSNRRARWRREAPETLPIDSTEASWAQGLSSSSSFVPAAQGWAPVPPATTRAAAFSDQQSPWSGPEAPASNTFHLHPGMAPCLHLTPSPPRACNEPSCGPGAGGAWLPSPRPALAQPATEASPPLPPEATEPRPLQMPFTSGTLYGLPFLFKGQI